MQPSLPRFSRLVRLCQFSVLTLALAALGAACDRHSASEVPESYGHGSRHNEEQDARYADHHIDSRKESKHFSDSQGVESKSEEAGGVERSEGAVTPKPSEKQAATPNPLGLGR